MDELSFVIRQQKHVAVNLWAIGLGCWRLKGVKQKDGFWLALNPFEST
jgi:hypothetical protein